MSDLYDTDIVKWPEEQAALLRRLAGGERINGQIDWENVIEEVESVGRSEVKGVRSAIIHALLHDLKAEAWPLSRDVPHWRAEARGRRDDARDDFTESMRTRIDITVVYKRARRLMPDTVDGRPPQPVPETCPVTLDELPREPEA